MLTPRRGLMILLMTLGCTLPCLPKDAEPGAEPTTTTTSYGAVLGQVYDAKSGSPLEGVCVSLQEEGQFPAEGRTVGKTDTAGRYKLETRLGRVSESISVGEVLRQGLIGGLLLGGAKKRTKYIDVSCLSVRVVCDGYKPFEGAVPCRSADAAAFRVNLEPIFLIKQDQSEEPGIPSGWGAVRLVDVVIDPPILRPGMTATVVAKLQGPREFLVEQPAKQANAPSAKAKLDVSCWSFPSYLRRSAFRVVYVFPKGFVVSTPGLVKNLRLKPAAGQTDETVTYTGQIKVAKDAKPRDEVLSAGIYNCPYDVAENATGRIALLQVVTNDEEERLARTRLEAVELSKAGDTAAAVEKMREICQGSAPTAADFQRLATFAEAIHDYAVAAEAVGNALPKVPDKERPLLFGEYGRLLLLADRPESVLAELPPLVEKVPEKSRPKEIPIDAMASIGMAYVKTADLEKANTTNDQMTKWSKIAVPTQLCAEFRRALRQAHVEAALRAKPDDAQALADYGRVMIDLGRWDEAGQSLRKAAQINPNLPGVQWDLHYALLQASGGKETAGTNFEEALKVAEAAVAPADGKQERTRDFFAWHQLAILLYRKAWMQQTAGDAAAADTRRRCRESLAEALKCGRAAGKVERESLYQPKIVGITGFAFLEANHDYLILEGSRAVEKNPQDYLAWLSLASGLLDLKQYDLAGAALQKCMSIRPDSCQAQYCAGVIALRTGDRGLAARALQDVLRVNPWHPEANLTLAEIYTDEGDTAAAAAYLAAHAQWYGIPPAE